MKELESRKDSKPVVVQQTSKKWSLEDESEDEADKDNDNNMEIDLPPPAPLPPIKVEKDEDFVDKKVTKEVVEEKPKEEEDDDVDPLDAYMMEVANEVKKVNQISNPAKSNEKGVVIVTGMAKKKTEIKKGELIEQNQDGLEYSSEEELDDIKDAVANLANKHKKELAKIDHSEMNYNVFRKNFYVEVPELARMTQSEVDAYRAELEGIQVKGKGCPKPIKVS